MHPIINCPICKIQLNENNICKNCLKNYFKNGYFNFCSSEIKEQKNIEIEKILKRIEIEGYEDGLNKYFNNKFAPHYEGLKKGEQKISCLSYEKIKKNLGWQPLTNIDEGLDKTYCWFLMQRQSTNPNSL